MSKRTPTRPHQPIARWLGASALSLALSGSALALSVGDLQTAVNAAHAKYKGLNAGATADYIPELAKVPADLFGVAIVTLDGKVYTAGDVDYAFSIQSISKPFASALMMEQEGVEAVRAKIGVEPTGMALNSILGIDLQGRSPRNPLVNAGAIATISAIEAKNETERWNKVLDWMSDMAGEKLTMLDDVYKSEAATNWNNRAIGWMLHNRGKMYSEPMEAVDVYTKECSIGVTAKQLAMMGATLANGGKNVKTGKQVMKGENVPELLAVMMMAGFYDESGLWAYTAGLPAKTGVGGGIVAVVPGKMAIAAFSPRVNDAGNSVRAMNAIEYISRELGLSIFGANAGEAVLAKITASQ